MSDTVSVVLRVFLSDGYIPLMYTYNTYVAVLASDVLMKLVVANEYFSYCLCCHQL